MLIFIPFITSLKLLTPPVDQHKDEGSSMDLQGGRVLLDFVVKSDRLEVRSLSQLV